jgi:lycopene cyclase domain-containing protein
MNMTALGVYTYLALMVFTLLGPLSRSFEPRIQYYKKWYALFPALIITNLYFIPWDVWFEVKGIWWFSNDYTIGFRIFNLPIEEWMFFFLVPFACVFIYECTNLFIKKDYLGPHAKNITAVLMIAALVLSAVYNDRMYTLVSGLSAAAMLGLHLFVFKAAWLGRFYIGFAVSLIPFFLVNGVLTAIPIVFYNNEQNMAIRMGTIPVEDLFYCLTLLLMTTTIYEAILKRNWG